METETYTIAGIAINGANFAKFKFNSVSMKVNHFCQDKRLLIQIISQQSEKHNTATQRRKNESFQVCK